METFLYVFAGALMALVVVGLVGWLWLKSKLNGLGEALGALGHMAPPFRISLGEVSDGDWNNRDAVDAASREFEALGYQPAGEYRINEMDNVFVRALWHPEHVFVAIWDYQQVGIYADLVRSLAADRWLTVSCAPRNGMDRPDFAPLLTLEADLADAATARLLHERMQTESHGHTPLQDSAASFPAVLVDAYRRQMDWLIERGGVSADEIRRIAELGGQEPPEDCAVELTQGMWRAAIEEFVREQAMESFLTSNPMSAGEWEERRERVRVVHEHCDRDEMIEELAWRIIEGSYDEEDDEAEDRAFEQAKRRLESLRDAPSFTEAFAAAQSLLPEKQRYERLGSVAEPWAADIWLEPEERDE